MIVFDSGYYRGDVAHQVVRYISSEAEPEPVTKHYRIQAKDLNGFTELNSYEALQYFSAGKVAQVGNEKAILHFKETIPVGYIYEGGGSYVTDWNYGPATWWPRGGYNLVSRWNGWLDFVVNEYSPTRAYLMIRNNWIRWFPEKGVTLVWSTSGYYNQEIEWGADPLALADRVYSFIDGILTNMSYDEIRAKPSEFWYGIGVGSGPTILSGSDYRRWRTSVKNCYAVDVSGAFEPKRDMATLQLNHPIPTGLRSEVAGRALSATSFDSNTIANLFELYDLAKSIKDGSIIKDIGQSITNLKSAKVTETLGDYWLKYRYAYSTTISDLNELKSVTSAGEPTVMRGGQSTDAGTMHMKIRVVPKSSHVGQMVDRLTKFGVAPNLYNLWDMIPFSFVVDWFTHVGDLLENITQYGRVAAYDVVYCTTSWHWFDTLTIDGITAKCEYYSREVSSTAPTYVPYVDASSSTRTNVKRLADSVALIS